MLSGPLYFPRWALQAGHVCLYVLNCGMHQGTQQKKNGMMKKQLEETD